MMFCFLVEHIWPPGSFGILDFDLLFINPTHLWAQIVGALLLGIGFTVGGYCPGTSIVAVASGKLDGMVYVAGFFAGLFLFPNIFDSIHDLYEAGHMGRVLLIDLAFNIRLREVSFHRH